MLHEITRRPPKGQYIKIPENTTQTWDMYGRYQSTKHRACMQACRGSSRTWNMQAWVLTCRQMDMQANQARRQACKSACRSDRDAGHVTGSQRRGTTRHTNGRTYRRAQTQAQMGRRGGNRTDRVTETPATSTELTRPSACSRNM